MIKEEVVAKIATEVVKIDDTIKVKDVKVDKDFSTDLGFDSLDTAELIISLEREYKIKMSDDILVGINTVGELADAICRQMEKKEDKI